MQDRLSRDGQGISPKIEVRGRKRLLKICAVILRIAVRVEINYISC
jgi:hypothetical protein